MHKVFISYHHANDQYYKDELLRINREHGIFIDGSVDTGDISDYLTDEAIREKIRDEYLKDTTVTILLVGLETKYRKHVDWELYSSMFDGKINKKSGILVVNLPSVNCSYYTATHYGEKENIYSECNNWIDINNRVEYERRYPYMPARIIDNLLVQGMKISVTNWENLTVNNLRLLIDGTCDDRQKCNYNLSRKMRRSNSNSAAYTII